MTTQVQIDAMKAALQSKREGRSVVKVASGGRSIEYDKLSIQDLEQAITRAERDLAGRPRRGAIKPYFA